ncbi:MAG: hypothetical protein IJZ81_04965 [Clostridia bacterium]|nr:hypothetical protein [Clostridia bacterium]
MNKLQDAIQFFKSCVKRDEGLTDDLAVYRRMALDALERLQKTCGTCRFYTDGICGSIHGMSGKVCKNDYCSHHRERNGGTTE